MKPHKQLTEAIALAIDAHDGQVDLSGRPYIRHPLRVMESLGQQGQDIDVMVVGVLHDVVEDSRWTLESVKGVLELSTQQTAGLDSVTRREDEFGDPAETYEEFILRAKADIIGRQVKIQDVLDNLLPWRINDMSKKYEVRYRTAIKVLTGWAK